MTKRDPFNPVDDDARALARELINSATYAALAVLENGHPAVTRIAFATTPDGAPLSLISDLSSHTQALLTNPTCSLLVGEPEDKGDPLTHPRITLHATAHFVARGSAGHGPLRAHYLAQRPKAKLYIDFGDFRLVRFDVHTALLNGGFGRAYKLAPQDLLPAR
ncbi:MAG: pyridoxamine 5'-phosphate oxidase family protein [Roseobacter sp.]